MKHNTGETPFGINSVNASAKCWKWNHLKPELSTTWCLMWRAERDSLKQCHNNWKKEVQYLLWWVWEVGEHCTYLPQKQVNCWFLLAPHSAPGQKWLHLHFLITHITQELLRPSIFPIAKELFLFPWEKQSVQSFQVFFPSKLPLMTLFRKSIHICSSPNSICCLITPSRKGHARAAVFLATSHLSRKEQDRNIVSSPLWPPPF